MRWHDSELQAEDSRYERKVKTVFILLVGDGYSAVASLALGTLIIVKWPSSSFGAIGTLVGGAVLMGSIARIAVASKIRSGASGVNRAIQGVA